MQTFLPYSDFSKSAACLDDKRLGKQRVECLQLLGTNLLGHPGWKNHPCAVMWHGYNDHLIDYGVAICREWRRRGFRDEVLERLQWHKSEYPGPRPPWLGDSRLHHSHQSNLLRKNPTWYGRFGWTVPDNLSYFWPGKHYVRSDHV